MLRPILRYGERPLHVTAQPVTRFDDELQRLIDDMVQTMYGAPGIGLAATQVGVPLRIFVVDLSVGRDPSQLIVASTRPPSRRAATVIAPSGATRRRNTARSTRQSGGSWPR